MGIFHDTIKDAIKELNKGNVQKAKEILGKHKSSGILDDVKELKSSYLFFLRNLNGAIEQLDKDGGSRVDIAKEQLGHSLGFLKDIKKLTAKLIKDYIKLE